MCVHTQYQALTGTRLLCNIQDTNPTEHAAVSLFGVGILALVTGALQFFEFCIFFLMRMKRKLNICFTTIATIVSIDILYEKENGSAS